LGELGRILEQWAAYFNTSVGTDNPEAASSSVSGKSVMTEESRSLHIESNNKKEVCRDAKGKPLEGTLIDTEGIIHRFRGGFLDGDVEGSGGKFSVFPAVEWNGHLEYWRQGALHRDNGLPAVVSEGFEVKEWWDEGIRIK
jgi:hypothetical protein